jgi:hypothetical protein
MSRPQRRHWLTRKPRLRTLLGRAAWRIIRGLPTLRGSVRWIDGTRIGVAFQSAIPLEMLVDWVQDRRTEAVASLPAPAAPH